MREEDGPVATKEVVEPHLAVGGLNGEVRDGVAERQAWHLCSDLFFFLPLSFAVPLNLTEFFLQL